MMLFDNRVFIRGLANVFVRRRQVRQRPVISRLPFTGATYTLVGDWPVSQSPEWRAEELAVDAAYVLSLSSAMFFPI